MIGETIHLWADQDLLPGPLLPLYYFDTLCQYFPWDDEPLPCCQDPKKLNSAVLLDTKFAMMQSQTKRRQMIWKWTKDCWQCWQFCFSPSAWSSPWRKSICKEEKTLYRSLFDLDDNGVLDAQEQALELMAIMEIISNDEEEDDCPGTHPLRRKKINW